MIMESGSSSSRPLIPEDIIIEILSRLPVKSLVRFSCVCKFWLNLITSDNIFIRCYLQNCVKSNKNINPSTIENVHVDNGEDRCTPCICHEQPDHQIKKLIEELMNNCDSDYSRSSYRIIFKQDKFSLAGCCDGIICFVKDCFRCKLDPNLTVYLCNPALHQLRALPRSYYHTKSNYRNTKVCFISEHDDYKVVKIIEYCKSFMVETYSLSSNAWKPLICSGVVSPESDDQLVPLGMISEFVVHNGFPYWLGFRGEQGTTHPYPNPYVLKLLDMNQKEFREIQLPVVSKENYFRPFYLFEIQGSLCVTRPISGSSTFIRDEVWLLKEDISSGDICWSMQFVFAANSSWLYHLPSRTTGLTATGKHLILSQEGGVFLYDPDNIPGLLVECNTKAIDFPFCQYVVADYVASLVSVLIPFKTSSSLDEKVQQRQIFHGEN